jgi:hypothetical protein
MDRLIQSVIQNKKVLMLVVLFLNYGFIILAQIAELLPYPSRIITVASKYDD